VLLQEELRREDVGRLVLRRHPVSSIPYVPDRLLHSKCHAPSACCAAAIVWSVLRRYLMLVGTYPFEDASDPTMGVHVSWTICCNALPVASFMIRS
jgi:hypothetical protein